MKNVKIIVLSVSALATLAVVSAFSVRTFTKSALPSAEQKITKVTETNENQTINLFVTHGHCSTPFVGKVNNLEVVTQVRADQGNPLEGLEVSFEIDPETFNVCSGEEYTERIKTPGLFIGEADEKMTFRSTEVFTMGLNWYQLNGKLSIKGEERYMKFLVSGIRDPKESESTLLILEGQVNLLDWGIDYDKIVFGESNDVPTKMMHLNMQVKLD